MRHIARYVALIALGLVWMTGCGGDGGGSGSDGGGDSTPRLTVASVQLGTPISSVDGSGSVNGPLLSGNLGEVIIPLDPENPSGYMSVWMQVNVSGATISHYDWEIVGWQNQEPFGDISYYDEAIDIDPDQGGYRVRSVGNKVRYDSMSDFVISSNHNELIKVTAWTVDGFFTTAYFNLVLVPIDGYFEGENIIGTTYKGATHFHVSESGDEDARNTTAEMVQKYIDKGFDFVSPAAHNYKAIDPSLGILFIDGVEETNAEFDLNHTGDGTVNYSITGQALIDAVNATGIGMPVINHVTHPTKSLSVDDLLALDGWGAMEIYNFLSEALGQESPEEIWDGVLTAGRNVWGMGTDDAHNLGSVGRGFVEVNADSLTEADILSALEAGKFYASSGAFFEQVICDGLNISVTTRAASLIEFIGANGAVLYSATSATSASYRGEASDIYVRVKITYDSDASLRAWSNAFFHNSGRNR